VITIGIDPHKDTHTAAAVADGTGQLLGELTIPGTAEGHERLLTWAHELAGEGGELRFALEDCRHVNGRLERFLLGAEQLVLRVGTPVGLPTAHFGAAAPRVWRVGGAPER